VKWRTFRAIIALLVLTSAITKAQFNNNIRISDDPSNQPSDQAETAVAIDPANPDHQFVTWNEFRHTITQPGYAITTNNTRPDHSGDGFHFVSRSW